MIQLSNISVVFEKGTALERIALEKIDISIETSDFVTVIGSNGAGKSTLLSLLAGEIIPNHGRIFFDKKNVTTLSVEERAKWIGHVYQDPRLGTCEALTIEENLALALSRGERRGLKSALMLQIRDHFRSRLADLDLGLEMRLSERVERLSGGQRQALSLVMATLNPPKILLLDEHTSALDPKIAKKITEITQQFVKRYKLTTVMVTHNISDALAMGNRTLIMRQGRIVGDLQGEGRKGVTSLELMNYF